MGDNCKSALQGAKRPIGRTDLLVISAVILAQLIDKKGEYNSKIENNGAN